MENLTIYNLSNDGICFCEAQGLSKVFQAYADYCTGEAIIEGGIGFNPNSGIVYIALENGVSICSMLGQDVSYLVTNCENGNEYFLNTYEEALNYDVYEIGETLENQN
jgi:hypothetical protein